jgi:DNA polymerase III delta prime subunit
MAGLLRASEEGLTIINLMRRNLRWNKTEVTWCLSALTSQATLKRFWARRPIRRETFIDICKAVGINNWEDIIERNDIKQTELLLAAAIADLPQDSQNDKNFPLPDNLPPVRNWVERTKEIDILKAKLINTDIIALSIIGLPGIGKTSLISQLIRQLHTENTPFTAVAWQSLQSVTSKAPPFDWIIDSLLFTLSNDDITTALTAQDNSLKKIEKLIKILKTKPCLICFDRVETLLKTKEGESAGYFADDCTEYAWLFKQLTETEHQSKIIFISRETLAELSPIFTREITIKGLDNQAAIHLINNILPQSSGEEIGDIFSELSQRYQGHPKALQLVASFIRDDNQFQGDICKFLQDRDWLLLRDIETLIDEIIARMSDLEKTCLSRISVYKPSEYPITYDAIAAQMPEISPYSLKENIILALKRRQVLYYHCQQNSYYLHPLVQEKGDRVLRQNPENYRNCHQQAYRYFLSLSLQNKGEWQKIEDLKPLICAHYHANESHDLETANNIIAEMYEYLQKSGNSEINPLSLLNQNSKLALNSCTKT